MVVLLIEIADGGMGRGGEEAGKLWLRAANAALKITDVRMTRRQNDVHV